MWTKILIVDDEEDIVEVLQETFMLKDFMVYTASSGNKAKLLMSEHEFDVVVSDIRMNDGSGIDLLEFIQNLSTKKPLTYMITGFSDYKVEDVIRLGGKDLVPKPFKIHDLLKRIQLDLDEMTARVI